MFGNVNEKAKEIAGEVQERYGEITDDYRHQAKGLARKATAQSTQAVQEAAEVVRNNVENRPFAAISVAAGIGLLIGLLIGRK